MICLLCLVMLFGNLVWAQPDFGPETVLTVDSTHSIATPRIVMVDPSSVRLFWIEYAGQESRLMTAVFDVNTHILTSPPEILRVDSVTQQIHDCVAETPERWAVAVSAHRANSSSLYCLTNGPLGLRQREVANSFESQVPWMDSWGYTEPRFAPRVGGGWLMSWVGWSCGGPFGECSSQVVVNSMADSVESFRQVLPPEYSLFGPTDCFPLSRSHDTSWVFVPIVGFNFESPALLRSYPGRDENVLDTVCTFDCLMGSFPVLSGFGLMHDGQMVLYGEHYPSGNALYQLDDQRTCELVADLDYNSAPERTAFHPNAGFVGTWSSPSLIQLARLSPNGDSQAPGVFYWRDSVHVISESDPVIMDDGRIFVLWTERNESRPNATRFLIAGIHWDTPLAAEESHFVPQPSSASLTASPNPFNSELRIVFELPRAGEVELAVYNVMGQKVAALLHGNRTAGTHHVAWQADCAGGIYFVRLAAGLEVQTEKVLYLR